MVVWVGPLSGRQGAKQALLGAAKGAKLDLPQHTGSNGHRHSERQKHSGRPGTCARTRGARGNTRELAAEAAIVSAKDPKTSPCKEISSLDPFVWHDAGEITIAYLDNKQIIVLYDYCCDMVGVYSLFALLARNLGWNSNPSFSRRKRDLSKSFEG